MEIAIKMAAIVIITICLIFMSFSTYTLFNTLDVIYDTTQAAMLSQVTVNAEGALHGFRESSGTARSFDGSSWVYSLNETEMYDYLAECFRLDSTGARYIGSTRLFRISNINVLGVNKEGNNIAFTATVDAAVPLHFGGSYICDISKTLKVKAIYDKRY